MRWWWQLSPSERKARLERRIDAKWGRETARIDRIIERRGMDTEEHDKRLRDLCAWMETKQREIDKCDR